MSRITKQLLIIIFSLLTAFSAQAQIKPTAMLLPIYFVDLDKKGLQGSLNNHVQTELSAYYELKSEKEVEQARDAAVDKLASENCTEEACVKIMGELLDVEYTFSLEIIDTGEGWDLTAVRQDMDGVSSRRNELCKNCNLSKARKTLSGMLTALRPGEMLIQRGKASLRLESTPRAQVFLDGRDQGKTPLDLSVDARKPLEVLMVAEGYNDFTEEFTLQPGEKRKKHAKLTRKRGRVRIYSKPSGAYIFLNGELQRNIDGTSLKTPANLRPAYSSYTLTLKLEHYNNFVQSLNINKPNHGTKSYTLQPKPVHLVVRVPSEHKYARVYVNDRSLGSMGGNIVRSFEVPSNEWLSVWVRDGLALSEKKSSKISPGKSGKVSFVELIIPERPGWRWGFGLEHDRFSFTLKGASGKIIKSNYNIFGFEAHGLRLPGRQLFSVKLLNGSGSITEPEPPFYLVGEDKLYTITGTSVQVLRLLYASSWSPGWNYAYGWEKITFVYHASQGNQQAILRSPIIEGGYEFSDLFGWLLDNNMFLETRLRYSLSTGAAFNLSFGKTLSD